MRAVHTVLILLVAAAVAGWAAAEPAGAQDTRMSVSVRHAQQIARQQVPTPPRDGNQSDVVVQAQVAATPGRPDLAVAVTEAGLQQGPLGTTGVTVVASVTRDGGATWHAGPVPGITVADGGSWNGIAWPTDAVGPDGAVYVVAALRRDSPCDSGIGVVRSFDGGRSWRPMVLAHDSGCYVRPGRSSITVDAGADSPYRGRIYLAWTSYHYGADGSDLGQVQTLSHSDDRGATWSAPVYLTGPTSSTWGDTVVVAPDGTVTDVYGKNSPDFTRTSFAARTSTDGGRTFGAPARIAQFRYASVGAEDIRCCAPSASVDPVTGEYYVAFSDARFERGRYDDALVYRSGDARTWTGPVVADTTRHGVEHMTAQVAAYAGTVYVTWALTDDPNGTAVRQQVAASTDGGRTFGAPADAGPRGDLHQAALASGFGYWLGDVTGICAVPGRAYLAWPLPRRANAPQRQTLWGAVATAR